MLKNDDFLKARVVELGWRFGAAYGGHIAGTMVMQVLANRFRQGWANWLTIIENVPNFMAENELPPFVLDSVWNPSFNKLLHAIDGIFDGSAQDNTKGALYFCDLNKVERAWFKEKVLDARRADEPELRQHPMVANLNSLSFFK